MLVHFATWVFSGRRHRRSIIVVGVIVVLWRRGFLSLPTFLCVGSLRLAVVQKESFELFCIDAVLDVPGFTCSYHTLVEIAKELTEYLVLPFFCVVSTEHL